MEGTQKRELHGGEEGSMDKERGAIFLIFSCIPSNDV